MIVPESNYSRDNEIQHRADMDRRLERTHSRERDLELRKGQRIIMRSPNGTRYALTVSDAGAIVVTSL